MDPLTGSGDERAVLNTQQVAEPLARASTWMRVVGALMVVQGAMTALTIIGILWAWIPIWMGVLLFQAAGAAERAEQMNDPSALHEAHLRLKKLFTMGGILAILSVLFMIMYFVALFAFGMSEQFGTMFEEIMN